jgi:hypothetical protein
MGPGIAPKALANMVPLAEGGVCFGGAAAMATNELRPVAGGDCPGAAPGEPDDGSIVTEGMLCSLTVSSLAHPRPFTSSAWGLRS